MRSTHKALQNTRNVFYRSEFINKLRHCYHPERQVSSALTVAETVRPHLMRYVAVQVIWELHRLPPCTTHPFVPYHNSHYRQDPQHARQGAHFRPTASSMVCLFPLVSLFPVLRDPSRQAVARKMLPPVLGSSKPSAP